MKTITLSAQDFFYWLSQRGAEIKEPIWRLLETSCESHNTYEHQFFINHESNPWSVKISTLFISSRKLKMAGWISMDEKINKSNEILVGTILMNLISARIPSQKTNQNITPYLTSPELGVKIEAPTSKELDLAWNSLTRVAPTINLMAKKISLDLRMELGQSLEI